jgi:hypothetical protein
MAPAPSEVAVTQTEIESELTDLREQKNSRDKRRRPLAKASLFLAILCAIGGMAFGMMSV